MAYRREGSKENYKSFNPAFVHDRCGSNTETKLI